MVIFNSYVKLPEGNGYYDSTIWLEPHMSWERGPLYGYILRLYLNLPSMEFWGTWVLRETRNRDAKQQDYEPKSWTNGSFSRGCWFFERGCCRFGDSCAYSHKTWNIVGSAAFCGCWWILWLPCYAGQIWSSVLLNVFFLTWNGDVGGLGWWFHYWAALGRKELPYLLVHLSWFTPVVHPHSVTPILPNL